MSKDGSGSFPLKCPWTQQLCLRQSPDGDLICEYICEYMYMEEKIDRFYPLAFITESQKVGFGADCIAADIWASTSPLFLILLRLGLLRYPSHLYQPLFTLKTKFTWWISFKCKGILMEGEQVYFQYVRSSWKGSWGFTCSPFHLCPNILSDKEAIATCHHLGDWYMLHHDWSIPK